MNLKLLWKYRNSIADLVDAPVQLSKSKDALHLANLEIADLTRRLECERASALRSKSHSEKLWQFIAIRHRVDVPAENGTIRKILQEAETR